VRVTLTKYGGPLSDATVLSWDQRALAEITRTETKRLHRTPTGNEVADAWWERVTGSLSIMRPKPERFSASLEETRVRERAAR
jgi:hypothetical protein